MAAATSSLDLLKSLNKNYKEIWTDSCYLEAVRNASTDTVNVLNYLYENNCGNMAWARSFTKNVEQVSLISNIYSEIFKKDNVALFTWFLDNIYVPKKVHIGKLIVEHNAINCLYVIFSGQYKYELYKNTEYSDIVKHSCKNIEFLKKVFESWIDNPTPTNGRIKALLKGLSHTNFETYQYLFEHGILAAGPAKNCIKAIRISNNSVDNLKKLTYTKDKGCKFSTHALKFASVRDVNCVKWLYDNYGQCNIWSPKFIQRAAKAGRLENIKFARTNGCHWRPTAYYWTKHAIDRPVSPYITEYLKKNDCPIDWRVKYMWRCNEERVKYLNRTDEEKAKDKKRALELKSIREVCIKFANNNAKSKKGDYSKFII
jgi:hypothetical protein